MDIDKFKQLTFEEKLLALKHHGTLLGPYSRNSEFNDRKVPGDIYQIETFYVYLSEDEKTVVPSRRNPLPVE